MSYATKPVQTFGDGNHPVRAKARNLAPVNDNKAGGGGNFAALMRGGSLTGQTDNQGESFAALKKTGLPSGEFLASRLSAMSGQNSGILAKVLETSSAPLQTLNSLKSGMLNRDEASITALRTMNHRKKSPDAQANGAMGDQGEEGFSLHGLKNMAQGFSQAFVQRFRGNKEEQLGVLSGRFESGEAGISAIGYDSVGGTSYGKFQIASKTGTMQEFLKYLESAAPDLQKRLKAAGPANTGGKRGGMPAEWQKIASEQPDRFETLQTNFIKESHFMPALNSIAEKTGLKIAEFSGAIKEVLFSTAVQHGPNGAARIFARAVDKIGSDKLGQAKIEPEQLKKTGENLIREVYAQRSGQFSSSTPQVQGAVKNRLKAEMNIALDMFKGDLA